MIEKTQFHFSRKDTSEIMGISAIALGQWKIEWDIKKGNATFYDIRKVVEYRLNRDDKPKTDLTASRSRLANLQADKVDLELKTMRGELIPLDQIGIHWQSMAMAMRAKLLSMPSKLAVAAIEAESIDDIEEVITNLIYEALDEISEDGIPPKVKGSYTGDILADEATSKSNGKRVGGQVQKAKPRVKRGTGAVADK